MYPQEMLFRTLPRHCYVVLRQTLSALVISCSSGTALLPIPSVCSSFGAFTPPNFAAACPALLRFRSSAFHRAMAYVPSSHFIISGISPSPSASPTATICSCLHKLITITEHSNRISASNNYSQTRHCRALHCHCDCRLPVAGCCGWRLMAAGWPWRANPPAPKTEFAGIFMNAPRSRRKAPWLITKRELPFLGMQV